MPTSLWIRLMLLSAVLLTPLACTKSASRLTEIRLGMTKEQVLSSLGTPEVARGAVRNKFDQVVEVWQYRLALPSSDSVGQVVGKSMLTLVTAGVGAATFRGERREYWLYFLGDELVQWGEAGDWSREPERICEFRFRPQPSMQN